MSFHNVNERDLNAQPFWSLSARAFLCERLLFVTKLTGFINNLQQQHCIDALPGKLSQAIVILIQCATEVTQARYGFI